MISFLKKTFERLRLEDKDSQVISFLKKTFERLRQKDMDSQVIIPFKNKIYKD